MPAAKHRAVTLPIDAADLTPRLANVPSPRTQANRRVLKQTGREVPLANQNRPNTSPSPAPAMGGSEGQKAWWQSTETMAGMVALIGVVLTQMENLSPGMIGRHGALALGALMGAALLWQIRKRFDRGDIRKARPIWRLRP